MNKGLFAGLVLLSCLGVSLAAYCSGKPSPNPSPNLIPLYTDAPALVSQISNGQLYTMGNVTKVLHVWGTPYQMGTAHGTLLKSELNVMMPDLWSYLVSQVSEIMSKVPEWIAKIIANAGLDAALDLTYELTKDYTGAYFYEEMQGIADASGVDFKLLRRVHMIGELTKGSCSMYGAWGSATASTGHTFQLRALDWDTTGPYKDYPLVVVYHPNPNNASAGHPFVNVGFVGWIGTLTGVSATQLMISEIGVSFPDDTFGYESRIGIPFTFLMRDIIQFDQTVDDSISRIADAKRTCDLILGVGDGKLGYFRGFEYSAENVYVFDDTDMRPYNETWHPRIENIVYWGMDWLCPAYNQALGQQLQKFHGNITGENTLRYITPIVQTGSLHIAVTDLTSQIMWLSTARPDGWTGAQYAYDRQFAVFDLNELMNTPQPN
eukprot:TRINITY_DN4384_c0_g2_i2.p1 TRINITY_DN4384_c0_g2~~TRINITY_DN4384_c0_g2_i2.p1  ORF type:complete len:435 (-),score=78.13 TRINITY_DN4384_c0_g2_i2:66-1370(-)